MEFLSLADMHKTFVVLTPVDSYALPFGLAYRCLFEANKNNFLYAQENAYNNAAVVRSV